MKTDALTTEEQELLRRQGLEAGVRNQLTPIVNLIQIIRDSADLRNTIDKDALNKLIAEALATAEQSVQNIINVTHHWENNVQQSTTEAK